MDIHRCRFVPFPTSAINALAFNRPHVAVSEKSHKSVPIRLAVGRENGNIEIWNPQDGAWHQEIIIYSGAGRRVDALAWVTQPDLQLPDGKVAFGQSRLFSIGGAASITEWDLATARPRRHASGQHGDIWCLGAQPPASHGESSTRLVTGTGDGCLVLYSIEDDDLRLQRILTKSSSKKVHFVSVAFQSRHIVAVGCSDASIRIFDMRNGSMISKMTLGRDLAAGAKDIIVWCVKTLPNGDIVSGDSTGQVCVWDGKTYTQAQRIQSHNQDVLSMAVSADGSAIISGGMDKRTVLYRRLASQDSRWSKVFHRRYHTHDVKAMAAFEGRGMSVVVSGGSDASPVVIPLREAGLEHHRNLSHLPQSVPLLSAPKARLVVSWWGRELQVWRLPMRSTEATNSDARFEAAQTPKVLKRILLKGKSDITSASVSTRGSLLAVSTTTELKAFQLAFESSGFDRGLLTVTKASIADSVAGCGASVVRISPDGKWICLVQQGTVVILRAPHTSSGRSSASEPGSRPTRLRRIERGVPSHITAAGLGSYMRTVTQVAFAPDSRMLAVADLSGYIDTWILRGAEDGFVQEKTDGSVALLNSPVPPSSPDESFDEDSASEGRRNGHASSAWISNPKGSLLPKLPTAATTLSFSGATPSVRRTESLHGDDLLDYELLAVTTASRLLIFHPLSGVLTPWSRRNPQAQLPEPLRTSRDLIKAALWQGRRVWLYGASSLFMLDLSQDLARDHCQDVVRSHDRERGTKRKRAAPSTGAGDRMDSTVLDPQHIKKTHALPEAGTGLRDGWVDLDMGDADEIRHNTADDEDDDADEDADGGELQLMRETHAAEQESTSGATGRLGWWHTYKYRPILGVVLLEPTSTADTAMTEDNPQLEVALVERPHWDVPLPSRYMMEDDREARAYP